MKTYPNPLIQEHTIDTLTHVKQVLSLLEDFHLNSSNSESAYQKDTPCGLFWVLRCAKHALEVELVKLEEF